MRRFGMLVTLTLMGPNGQGSPRPDKNLVN
jgi:hypothetical protein